MHLKSLTLRGFKSFASATTLHFEPGITCVVGPNGSGKSNVVDALAWVMGEQGAKTLRGGSMQDVIFAGTSGRPPLGRAEVQLVIDNADGALPVDYAEVSISRTMFRSGGSEYAINGQPCRLLDVQELLSDSGIGREMHVVVGQGRLDEILTASPEDRRGFVEEAAGVLKHRKRKEKALRKLDATEANLTRLDDLLTEIRRQLKPLGRQADVARRAGAVQAEARDARARLLADDLVTAYAVLRADLHRQAALQSSRERLAEERSTSQEAAAAMEEAARIDASALSRATVTWHELCRLRERLAGTAGLAAERLRVLAEEPDEGGSESDAADLTAELDRVGVQEHRAAAERKRIQAALACAVADRRDAEAAQQEEDRHVAELARDAADRREEVARLTGQVNALRTRAAAADEELHRLGAARKEAEDRAERAQRRFTALETTVAGLDAGEHGLDAEHEAAQATLRDLDDRLGKLREELQAAERERSGLAARHQTLSEALSAADGAAAVLADRDRLPGVVGSIAELVSVEAGYETAVAAALGPGADAVVVRDLDAAVGVIRHLKEGRGGRAGLLPQEPVADGPAVLPAGARSAGDLVDAPPGLREAVRRLLARTAVVDDVADARAMVARFPELRAVTRDGDVVGRSFAVGGSPGGPSALEVRSWIDEAAVSLEETRHRCERLRFDLVRQEEERSAAARRVDVAVAKLHESDAALAAVAEELGELAALGRAATEEVRRLSRAVEEVSAARERDLAALAQAEDRLATAEAAPVEEPDTARLEELAAAARAAREAELEVRLALRTAEERAGALSARADALRRLARDQQAAGARAAARRKRRAAEAATARAVGAAVAVVLERLDRSVQAADAQRRAGEQAQMERERRLAAVRERVRHLDAELDRLTEDAHREDLVRAEHRIGVDALEQRAADELGLDAQTLVAEFGPDRPVPAPEGDDPPTAEAAPAPFTRAEQEERLRRAERALAVLGKVNPLALEEFSALEERHRFLTEQLADVKRTRTDLLQIIRDVDDRVRQVLSEAMADTAREFAGVFSRLFPGGEGRLVLTDPDEVLTSGLDVEARPAGKSVKRLSLLSGGERALVAVAFLVALFKARPSPFYVLDEVEAALDDTNLGRLLDICTELRDSSQLLIVTHQKRTMEIADALYGVSMRGDGVSTVISQRLRTAAAQPA